MLSLHVQLPEDNRTLCEVDTDFEIFPGVDTEAILAAMAAFAEIHGRGRVARDRTDAGAADSDRR